MTLAEAVAPVESVAVITNIRVPLFKNTVAVRTVPSIPIEKSGEVDEYTSGRLAELVA